jgi:spore coat protein YutH
MKEILKRFFPYQFQYPTRMAGYTAYQESDGYVIVLEADYLDENEIAEQHVIADFIHKSGYEHVAVPVYSNNETFIVPINEGSSVYLLRAKPLQSEGNHHQKLITFLQSFHHLGHQFPYTPLYNNRYGEWKYNWEQIIDQIDILRQSFINKKFLTEWEREWLQCSFYFIGFGENAIQYLQETEQDKNFNQYDQPVFTFERINPFPNKEVVLPKRIVHDHPSRDLAELIRHLILTEGKQGVTSALQLLRTYQQKRPLSIFGWRLLFARLLFPIHFIDYTSKVMNQENTMSLEIVELKSLISYQAEYEHCISLIYQGMKQNFQVELPLVEWIS